MLGVRAHKKDLVKFKILTLVVAALAGCYFGLFSCGGYIWHKHVAVAVLALMAVASLARAKARSGGLALNLAYVLSIPAVFVLMQAASAPFYPSPPASGSEYVQGVLRALEFGPC